MLRGIFVFLTAAVLVEVELTRVELPILPSHQPTLRRVEGGPPLGASTASSFDAGCYVSTFDSTPPYLERPTLPLPPVFAAYGARRQRDPGSGVVLTYWSRKHTDGAGSQVQRILGWYTIAVSLGLGYVHTPLHHVGYQGLQALEAGRGSEELLARWVGATALPDRDALGCSGDAGDGKEGRPPPTDGCRHVFFVEITLEALAAHVESLAPGERLVLHGVWAHSVLDPHPFLARHPSLAFAPLLPWLQRGRGVGVPQRELRIAVHVRRGELLVVDGHRMLPNGYYLQVCFVLGRVLREAGIPHTFDIYTEQVTKKISVTGASHGITNRTSAIVELAPEDTKLWELEDIVPQRLHLNTDPLEAFQDMARADILIQSRSSFSYAAAILADPRATLTLYPPDFWIAPLQGWLYVQKHIQKPWGNGEGSYARRMLRKDFQAAVSHMYFATPACNRTMESLGRLFYPADGGDGQG